MHNRQQSRKCRAVIFAMMLLVLVEIRVRLGRAERLDSGPGRGARAVRAPRPGGPGRVGAATDGGPTGATSDGARRGRAPSSFARPPWRAMRARAPRCAGIMGGSS